MFVRLLALFALFATPALAQVTLFPAHDASGATRTVRVYSSLDEPLARPMIEAFQLKNPTIAVAYEDLQTADIYERIVRETDAGAPTADFAFSSSMDLQMKLANDGYAQPARVPLSVNLKFFLEGEEEAGSPNLARTLAANAALLKSDVWIFGDGPIDPRGLPRVALGARGIISFRLTVYGPAMSLHSGHYGNVAPNPAARLAHLIASMRAEDGRVTIDGFTADEPSRAALNLARTPTQPRTLDETKQWCAAVCQWSNAERDALAALAAECGAADVLTPLFDVAGVEAVGRGVLTQQQRQDWHDRLLHGSDYPLPCVAPLVRLGPLVRAGVLAADSVASLEALRAHNPLLFDLMLKRCVRWRGRKLADAVFRTRAHFQPSA